MRSTPTLLFTIIALLPSLAQAEDAWTLRAVEALRWPDAEPISLQLEQGDKVTVVYRLDPLVRVRKDDAFGWVPQEALSSEDPSPAPATSDQPWSLDGPSLDFTRLGSDSTIKLTAPASAEPAATPEPTAEPPAGE